MDPRQVFPGLGWMTPDDAMVNEWRAGQGQQAPLALPAFGPEAVPLAAQAGDQPQAGGGAAQPPPLEEVFPSMAPPPAAGPDDVKAMRMENARRQHEQRYGVSPMGPGGQRQQSMAASGQRQELDALIARLSQARMAQMADRRTARRR
jgi:hypothetical protein